MTRNTFPILIIAASLAAGPALAADEGRLVVKSKSGGEGAIFVDGEDTGRTTPATLEGLAAGSHMVQVKGDCVSAVQQVNIDPDELSTLELDLKPLGGFLQITTSPSSATVTVDGKLQQNKSGIPAACGDHKLTISAPGYLDEEDELTVGMGEAYTLEYTLYPEGTGTLNILVNPASAEIFIDGKKESEGPIELKGWDVGTYMVEAFLEGYEPGKEEITLGSGQTREVSFDLDPVGGAVTDPGDDGGGMSINGRYIAGGALSAVGVGLVIGGTAAYGIVRGLAEDAQNKLNDGENFDQTESDYLSEAQPLYRRAVAFWALGGLAIAGGGAMFFIDDGGVPVVGYQARF